MLVIFIGLNLGKMVEGKVSLGENGVVMGDVDVPRFRGQVKVENLRGGNFCMSKDLFSDEGGGFEVLVPVAPQRASAGGEPTARASAGGEGESEGVRVMKAFAQRGAEGAEAFPRELEMRERGKGRVFGRRPGRCGIGIGSGGIPHAG